MNRKMFWLVVFVGSILVAVALGTTIGRTVRLEIGILLSLLGFGGIIGLIIYWLSGKRKLQSATENQRADALTMSPSSGKGRVYIVRTGFAAKLQGMDVTIGNVRTGQIKGGQFLLAELDPGNYDIAGQLARSGKGSRAEIQVMLSAGEVVTINTRMGAGLLVAKVLFTRIDGEEAKQLVNGAKMMCWDEISNDSGV